MLVGVVVCSMDTGGWGKVGKSIFSVEGKARAGDVSRGLYPFCQYPSARTRASRACWALVQGRVDHRDGGSYGPRSPSSLTIRPQKALMTSQTVPGCPGGDLTGERKDGCCDVVYGMFAGHRLAIRKRAEGRDKVSSRSRPSYMALGFEPFAATPQSPSCATV